MTSPLTEQQLAEYDTTARRYLDGHACIGTLCGPGHQLADGAQALLAEVRRLQAVLTAAQAKHKPRTERHGSGCVQCGTVWPCATYRDLAAAPAV